MKALRALRSSIAHTVIPQAEFQHVILSETKIICFLGIVSISAGMLRRKFCRLPLPSIKWKSPQKAKQVARRAHIHCNVNLALGAIYQLCGNAFIIFPVIQGLFPNSLSCKFNGAVT